MIRWIPGLLFSILLMGSVSGLQAQDRVILKNGSAFTGTILSHSDEWVSIKSSVGTLQFRTDAVERIEHGAGPYRGGERKKSRYKKRRKRGKTRATGLGFVKAARGNFGDVKNIRVDRHPAYSSLKRSKVGAWVLYSTPGKLPHHDQERWIVQAVNGNGTTVLKEHLLRGRVIGFERENINHLDFGPQMPVRIQKDSALSKEMIRTALGRFATLRISKDFQGLSGPTKNYCPEVPIIGLVQHRIGQRQLRRILRFAWEGGGQSRKVLAGKISKYGASTDRSRTPQIKSLPPNPVAAAFLEAKPGDYVVWRDPNSGKRWREIVHERTRTEVILLMQVWRRGAFRKEGMRKYDLGFLSGDFLERHGAKRSGEEKLQIGEMSILCKKWRSSAGNVEFWTSPRVHIGSLVRHTINGRVVRELVEMGNNARLLER